MPILQNAKKALRQSERRRQRNLQRQRAYKRLIKEFKSLVEANKKDAAQAKLSEVFKAIDKAAKAGIIHQNKAARLKSRLSKKLTEGQG